MKLMQKLENLFSAAAFAEAGEFDTAREMAREEAPQVRQAPAASRPALSGTCATRITPSSTKA